MFTGIIEEVGQRLMFTASRRSAALDRLNASPHRNLTCQGTEERRLDRGERSLP